MCGRFDNLDGRCLVKLDARRLSRQKAPDLRLRHDANSISTLSLWPARVKRAARDMQPGSDTVKVRE
jgi:hypothetical protein